MCVHTHVYLVGGSGPLSVLLAPPPSRYSAVPQHLVPAHGVLYYTIL